VVTTVQGAVDVAGGEEGIGQIFVGHVPAQLDIHNLHALTAAARQVSHCHGVHASGRGQQIPLVVGEVRCITGSILVQDGAIWAIVFGGGVLAGESIEPQGSRNSSRFQEGRFHGRVSQKGFQKGKQKLPVVAGDGIIQHSVGIQVGQGSVDAVLALLAQPVQGRTVGGESPLQGDTLGFLGHLAIQQFLNPLPVDN